MKHARFEILPYPTKDELDIWVYDENGRTDIKPEFAKTIPIIKLPSKRLFAEA